MLFSNKTRGLKKIIVIGILINILLWSTIYAASLSNTQYGVIKGKINEDYVFNSTIIIYDAKSEKPVYTITGLDWNLMNPGSNFLVEPSGYYAIIKIPVGDYKIGFFPPPGDDRLPEIYNKSGISKSATIIHITPGCVIEDVNFSGIIHSLVSARDKNIELPKQQVNTVSKDYTFTLESTSTHDVIINSIEIIGTNKDEFILIGNTNSIKIKPTEEETFRFAFLPTSPGLKTASIKINVDGDKTGPTIINVSGEAYLQNYSINVNNKSIGLVDAKTNINSVCFSADKLLKALGLSKKKYSNNYFIYENNNRSKQITFRVGDKNTKINNKNYSFTIKPYKYKTDIMIPLKFTVEKLGCKIKFDIKTNKYIIGY